MKIVSTFLLSNAVESDLLFYKLLIEDPYVSEWVIVVNRYSFRGQVLDFDVEALLGQSRLSRFKNRIRVIKLTKRYIDEYEPSVRELAERLVKRALNRVRKRKYHVPPLLELAYFYAEIKQRDAALGYILDKYDDETFLVPCDVDEILDLHEGKAELLSSYVRSSKQQDIFVVFRCVHYYDFDNYAHHAPCLGTLVRLRHIRAHGWNLHTYRHLRGYQRYLVPNLKLVFEYRHCFSVDASVEKLDTFSHVTGISKPDVELCLSLNIPLMKSENVRAALGEDKNLFSTIRLDASNSPAFVRNNLSTIKTNIVPQDYAAAREAFAGRHSIGVAYDAGQEPVQSG